MQVQAVMLSFQFKVEAFIMVRLREWGFGYFLKDVQTIVDPVYKDNKTNDPKILKRKCEWEPSMGTFTAFLTVS